MVVKRDDRQILFQLRTMFSKMVSKELLGVGLLTTFEIRNGYVFLEDNLPSNGTNEIVAFINIMMIITFFILWKLHLVTESIENVAICSL